MGKLRLALGFFGIGRGILNRPVMIVRFDGKLPKIPFSGTTLGDMGC
jgi:hypothetical protein